MVIDDVYYATSTTLRDIIAAAQQGVYDQVKYTWLPKIYSHQLNSYTTNKSTVPFMKPHSKSSRKYIYLITSSPPNPTPSLTPFG
jgi:hypothetical protein